MLKDNTRRLYSKIIVLLIAYPLRFYHLAHHAKEKSKPVMARSQLNPAISDALRTEVVGLLNTTLRPDKEFKVPEDKLHNYFAIFMKDLVNIKGSVVSLVDQILCFSSVRPSSLTSKPFSFQRANNITRNCAALQHGICSIGVHSVRLTHLKIPLYQSSACKQMISHHYVLLIDLSYPLQTLLKANSNRTKAQVSTLQRNTLMYMEIKTTWMMLWTMNQTIHRMKRALSIILVAMITPKMMSMVSMED